MTQFLIISSDCHAGALPETYNQYMPEEFRDSAGFWALVISKTEPETVCLGLDARRGARLSLLPRWAVRIGGLVDD